MNDRQAHLEQNIVAENLTGFYKTIEPYSKLILAGVVIVVVGLIGVGLYTSKNTAKRSDATLELLMDNPEVASQFPETIAAAWSLLFQGDNNLAQGINSLYQDRDEAETLLAQAKDQFNEARRKAPADKLLVSRASFGIGMAAESLGAIDEAVEAYKATEQANESEQMVEIAKERIERLSKPDSAEFLAWFSEQDFSPADPSLPPELPGASSLPDLPDLDLPELNLGDQLKSSDAPTTPIEGGIELPEMNAPAVDAPEAETPAAETPAVETPATEAPAVETPEAPAAEVIDP